VCLTVVERAGERLGFDLSDETLAVTTLGELGVDDPVNVERPLRLGTRLGGHLVLGHVDGIGTVEHVSRVESTARVRIALPGPALAPLLVPQGSVAVDGVSVTIAALERLSFEVMVIPHTLAVTTLGRLAPGQAVNLEMDVIGKYLQRSLELKGAP
jgi:riboflavin synthase alpha subunit